MKRFLALSRSTHGVLDIAMPGFVALLWLGRFPAWPVLAVCLAAAVAGYTAIYALNDIVGFKDDREKVAGGVKPGYAVEASALRYPIAQNLVSMKGALAWFTLWFALAVGCIWWLNPRILVILIVAAALEVVYVKLFKVTWWRTLVSGLVKSAGPVAAVFAVIEHPSWSWLALMVAWLVAWEIGGQNILADWNDIEEDRRVGARTIPLALGLPVAGWLVLALLVVTTLLSLTLPLMSPLVLDWRYLLCAAVAGGVLLIAPAVRLVRTLDGRHAAGLFDLSSLYPLAMLAIAVGFVLTS
ncbi:MAG: ubiquinone biosynthesis protein UbiA [Burkholderiaceae bacterium]|nr:MAG: ubiquinone biosynthesis protein UbiA [Burkholderiaceae bacterium]